MTSSSIAAFPARSPIPFDRALHLPRAGGDRGERVGRRQAEIIVAVGAQHDAVGARHPGQHGAEHLAVLGRHGVADRVGQVHRPGALLDRRLHHPAEEVGIGAARVLGRELDVVGVLACLPDRRARPLEHVRAGRS